MTDVKAAIEDFNRTLEQKSTGSGHYETVSVELRWLRYDEELDDLVPAEETETFHA